MEEALASNWSRSDSSKAGLSAPVVASMTLYSFRRASTSYSRVGGRGQRQGRGLVLVVGKTPIHAFGFYSGNPVLLPSKNHLPAPFSGNIDRKTSTLQIAVYGMSRKVASSPNIQIVCSSTTMTQKGAPTLGKIKGRNHWRIASAW